MRLLPKNWHCDGERMQLYELMAALEKSGMDVNSMHGVARMYKASMSSEGFLRETKRAIDNKKYKSVNALMTSSSP